LDQDNTRGGRIENIGGVTVVDRAEKIGWLIDAIKLVEGVEVKPSYYTNWTDERLDKEIEFYDYVLDK
jgi:hypothetical protein